MLHSGSPFSVFFHNIQTAFGATHMTGAGILLLLFCLPPFIMERQSGGKWGKMSRFSIKSREGAAPVTGEYMHTLDAKGRLAVPSRLRDELGGVFYVTLSMDRCLSAYSAESWQRFSDKVDAMPFVKQRKMRPLFAFAARCESDAQGRILLPQNLRDYAGLTKDVTIVGCNNHAELWDSARWNEIHETEMTPENIASVMEELEF